MNVVPLPTGAGRRPEALASFLEAVSAEAVAAGRPRLVSITVPVDHLEPLAVLEAIAEPGQPAFYAERPDREVAVAAAEEAVGFVGEGPDRFAAAAAWWDRIRDEAVAVGPVELPFGGPQAFGGFSFFDTVPAGAAFPPARFFVPCWQVARAGEHCVAVANAAVGPGIDPRPLAERIWRAHERFGRFEHVERTEEPDPAGAARARVVARTERAAFQSMVERALGAIREGAFEKIVLARRAVWEREGANWAPWRVVDRLRRRFPECLTFAFTAGAGAVFAGSSPERLVRMERGVVLTTAIAGTAPRGEGAGSDAALGQALLRSEKDSREHAAVVDSILRRLRELGLEPEPPGRPRLLRLANVQHLQTPLRATSAGGRSLLELVAALHPTPAMGGKPRDQVLPLLRSYEDFDRGLYAAPLGWMGHDGEGEFFVGIRSALLRGRQAELYAGVGIVAGSDPAGEADETDWKFRAFAEALG